jgi:hypothetical protein
VYDFVNDVGSLSWSRAEEDIGSAVLLSEC